MSNHNAQSEATHLRFYCAVQAHMAERMRERTTQRSAGGTHAVERQPALAIQRRGVDRGPAHEAVCLVLDARRLACHHPRHCRPISTILSFEFCRNCRGHQHDHLQRVYQVRFRAERPSAGGEDPGMGDSPARSVPFLEGPSMLAPSALVKGRLPSAVLLGQYVIDILYALHILEEGKSTEASS